MSMKGLQLSEQYFYQFGLPLFEKECRELLPLMAIGLVGDGSDCFGYDDEFSRDHDWGPAFCIWLNSGDVKTHGERIQALYDSLPKHFNGFDARLISSYGEDRVGVLEIESFYRRYLGPSGLPKSLKQWLILPENGLATAVNGKVFIDQAGQFSAIRKALQGYYPEDVRIKKIAARCMTAGQAGQYNYPRSTKRKEPYAAAQAEMKFIETALSLIFLLNKRYVPFYKWAHRAVKDLPVLGKYSFDAITDLMKTAGSSEKERLMEQFSLQIISALQAAGLTEGTSDFLPDHGPLVQAHIQDPEIRSYSVLIG